MGAGPGTARKVIVQVINRCELPDEESRGWERLGEKRHDKNRGASYRSTLGDKLPFSHSARLGPMLDCSNFQGMLSRPPASRVRATELIDQEMVSMGDLTMMSGWIPATPLGLPSTTP